MKTHQVVLVPAVTAAGVPPDWPVAPVLSMTSNCRRVPTGWLTVYEYGELWTLPRGSRREPTEFPSNELTVMV